jgi:hypothetical protein
MKANILNQIITGSLSSKMADSLEFGSLGYVSSVVLSYYKVHCAPALCFCFCVFLLNNVFW